MFNFIYFKENSSVKSISGRIYLQLLKNTLYDYICMYMYMYNTCVLEILSNYLIVLTSTNLNTNKSCRILIPQPTREK